MTVSRPGSRSPTPTGRRLPKGSVSRTLGVFLAIAMTYTNPGLRYVPYAGNSSQFHTNPGLKYTPYNPAFKFKYPPIVPARPKP